MQLKKYPTRKKDLYVKKSKLPGAGSGLFTRKAIAKGELVVEYAGRVTTWKEASATDIFNGYVFFVNRNLVIDAMKTTKALGRYANDARGIGKQPGLRNNARYEILQQRVYIEATRPIAAGEEILVGYGKEYWDVVRFNIKLAKKTKKK